MLEKVRVDKWLWSVRIFKSRTMASDACKGGRIKREGVALKPSQTIERNDVLTVKKEGITYTFKVVDLIEKRVSATLAQPCYQDLTPEEELNKFKNWYNVTAPPEQRDRGAGRPTKKERRDIDRFKSWE